MWSSPFFTTKFTARKFPIGSYCRITVPDDFIDSHRTFDDATVEIVSKKDYLAQSPIEKIEYNKVVCKIIDAPNAPKGIAVVGLEYPIRRAWLKITRHKCACDIKILMISGCKCGGY